MEAVEADEPVKKVRAGEDGGEAGAGAGTAAGAGVGAGGAGTAASDPDANYMRGFGGHFSRWVWILRCECVVHPLRCACTPRVEVD